jgi:hypothetical protein
LGLLIEKLDTGIQSSVTGRHRVEIVQFCTLDLFEQHRRNNRVIVFGLERQTSNQVGLCSQKVDRRTLPARTVRVHFLLLFKIGPQLNDEAHCSGRLGRRLETLFS